MQYAGRIIDIPRHFFTTTMEETPQHSSALSQLQSEAHSELLDAVDKLRLNGLENELDLPQLIVCGDQSSGKSSVLEAISHVQFPSNDSFCTQFASELILRTAPKARFSVYLVPAGHRSDAEKDYITSFCPPDKLNSISDFSGIVEEAKAHLEELNKDEPVAFYEDRLVASIQGPDLPQLTLVDLPGLIHTANKDQSTRDIAIVRQILEKYMANKNSIILAIVAADNNIANQAVLELAKGFDQGGVRTLGIITKPDRLGAGSQSEGNYIRYAQNQNIHLKLGWHVLRNRSYDELNASSEDRDALESHFFNSSKWNVLPKEDRGVQSLRDKLSRILLSSVRKNLPRLITGIQDHVHICEANLKKLGQQKLTEHEQRLHLTSISSKLQELVKASVEGHYRGDFFGDPDQGIASSRRLRARLMETLDGFADQMFTRALFYEVVPDAQTQTRGNATAIEFSVVPNISRADISPTTVSMTAALDGISRYLKENRGCELEGLLPSEAVAHLFKVQSSPWEAIANKCVEDCWARVYSFFQQALLYVAPRHVAESVLNIYAKERLEETREMLQKKVEELLRPYKNGHPVTMLKREFLRLVDESPLSREDHSTDSLDHTPVRRGSPEERDRALKALNYMRGYYTASCYS